MRLPLFFCCLASPAAAQLGTNYCPAVVNSTGVPSLISAAGSASVGLNDVTLECRELPISSSGYFLTSFARGFVANPAGSAGNLCLSQPIGRYVNAVLMAGAQGSVALPIELTAVPMPLGAVAVQPGDTLAFQFWHRDSGAQGPTSNFSGGLEIEFSAGCDVSGGIFAGSRFEAGVAPDFMVSGDLNGDGLVDLVATNPTDAELSVLFGAGDARFLDPVAISVGQTPTGLALGDMDGDGDLDVVCSNLDSNTVSVILNQGGGVFAGHVTADAGAGPAGLNLGDVDGDGDLDVVVANSAWTVDTVSVLSNDGAGGLGPRITLASQRTPRAVQLVDLDADGDQDLVVANGDSSTLATFLNDGTGSFGAARYDTATFEPRHLVTEDFDGDGHVDVVVANSDGPECAIQLGAGDGTYRSRISISAGASLAHLAAADLNGDGHLDLVGASATSLGLTQLLGLGDGTFSAPTLIAIGRTSGSVVAANFDAEPDVELAASLILANDIVVMGRDDQVGYQMMDSYQVGLRPAALALVDVSGDGVVDFLVANQGAPSLSLGIGRPDGTFEPSQVLGIAGIPVDLVAGDFDGDGDLDVAASNLFDESVSLLFNLGGGTFAPHQEFSVERFPRQLAAGDVDGDGDLDLITTHSGFGVVNGTNVWLNDGSGTFTLGSSYQEPTAVGGLELEDLDQDGDLDIIQVFSQSLSTGFRVLPNDGQGNFGSPVTVPSNAGSNDLLCMDLDGDGDKDIVLVGSSALEVFENLGGLSFGTALPTPAEGEALTNVAAGDLDLDGQLDLVTVDFVTGAASVLLGNGDLTWGLATRYALSLSPRTLALADLNGDGRLDLLCSAFGAREVTVHLNLCR